MSSSSDSANPKVHFVSLGCPKNRVDSEVMLGHLAGVGYEPAGAPEEADVIVVNTCAFIDAAKEESVEAILDAARYKEEGKAKKLVVAGCLSQRYAPELAKEIPEVDHFLGTGNFDAIADTLRGTALTPSGHPALPVFGQRRSKPHTRLQGKNALRPYRHDAKADDARPVHVPDPDFTLHANTPRLATQPFYTSYLKISEGCSNTCSFCIIPKLRGPQRSRPIVDIVEEAERLAARGTVEVNLIAQDLCAFGKDLEPRESLAELLRALDDVGRQAGHPFWIRCMYAYPRGLTDEVIGLIGEREHILPYLDMPLQHISDSILTRMRRGKGGESTKDLLRKLRARIPGLTLRTTFITGLPGETDEEFEELLELVEEIRFERMGVFTYSPEEDTPAAEMADQIAPEVAQERRDRLMEAQRDISAEQQEALIGKEVEVLVEGVSPETDLLLQGRHGGQAPDIDGVTYINQGTASPGQVVKICIEEAGEYDVAGGIIESVAAAETL